MKNFNGLKFPTKNLKPFLHFMWASDVVRRRSLSVLIDEGLTISQFGVLDTIYHLGPQPQCDLGKGIFRSSGNITKVVDNLEKKELVRRVRKKEDRRYYLVNLTPKGKALFQRVLPLHIQFVDKELSKLSQREQETLSRLCIKLGREEEEGK